MARHARPSRFTLLPRSSRASHAEAGRLQERRRPGATRDLQPAGYQPVALGSVARESTDDDLLRHFLEAMRRWQAEEPSAPVHISSATIRKTTDYVLSTHLDGVQDEALATTVLTLRAYLAALAEAAETHLDTGRGVVAQMAARARGVANDEQEPSLRAARLAAETARDLLTLLDQEGWQGRPVEAAS